MIGKTVFVDQGSSGHLNRSVMVEVSINQEKFVLSAAAVVADVLPVLGVLHADGVAIAVNGTVVARAEWADCVLCGGDEVFVIRATAGG